VKATTPTYGVVPHLHLVLHALVVACRLVFQFVTPIHFNFFTFAQDAVDILEPMTKDSIDFVRQGAFIALGMILVEQSEASLPSLASIRTRYAKVISDKHEDPMARFGAAIGQGFIDAGGRNVTISLQSRAGSNNTNAVVGIALFCQFWYWYPLAHCASLAFSPTSIIGLNGDLKVRSFKIFSSCNR
jgi:26S proteasome regulatory subunit N2